MSAQPEQRGQGLIPRPDRTPAALRAALTAIAPRLLPMMEAAKDRALAEAVEHGSIEPIHAFLAHWAAVIEIERFPDLAAAYHQAEYMARMATAPAEARQHVRTVGEIYRAAAKAVAA